jgi:hypothetical protein
LGGESMSEGDVSFAEEDSNEWNEDDDKNGEV